MCSVHDNTKDYPYAPNGRQPGRRDMIDDEWIGEDELPEP